MVSNPLRDLVSFDTKLGGQILVTHALLLLLASTALAGKRPNILLIVLDDAGYSDIGVYGELFGIRAYRLGKWKILQLPIPYGTGEWQLYDLSSDPGETTDLAASLPDRLKHLSDLWSSYASQNGVVEPDIPMVYAKPPN